MITWCKHIFDKRGKEEALSAGVKGIVQSRNCSQLSEFGGPSTLSRGWAYSLLQRMQFVKRKGTTAKSKQSSGNYADLKAEFLRELHTIITMEEIPCNLVLNWDRTGIKIVPASSWTMTKSGSQ